MIVTYGKKPRKGKDSEVVELEGYSFFLYNTKTKTKGNCEIYFNTEPYPLIKVSESNEKAKLWLKGNLIRVKEKVSNIGSNELINRDNFCKTKKDETIEVKKIHYPTPEECQEMFNKDKYK